jgi:hypothetical protein
MRLPFTCIALSYSATCRLLDTRSSGKTNIRDLSRHVGPALPWLTSSALSPEKERVTNFSLEHVSAAAFSLYRLRERAAL